MRSGIVKSIILHIVIGLLIAFGLPSLMNKKDLVDNSVVTVEILPVSELTNVKPKKSSPKPIEKPEKKEVITKNLPKIALNEPKPEIKKELTEEKKPAPVTEKKPEPKVAEKIPEKKPEPPKEEPKKEEEKKEEKPEIREDAFASVLKSVEEMRQEPSDQKDSKDEEKMDFSEVTDFLAKADNQPEYKPGLPLSVSEKDAIKQQIMKNWTVFGGAKDAADNIVTLKISLAEDGSVRDVEVVDKIKYSANSFFRAMADRAKQAVYKSSPLKNLPPEKYDVKDGWREIEINFDPRDMLY